MSGQTVVHVEGDRFHVNGEALYAGTPCEGLLMNSRMVQGIFDDLNPDTRSLWDYPDGPWDPRRNNDEFIAAMPAWRERGLIGFTINLQGGSPQGYSKAQPWHNSAFEADGALRPDYMARLARILDRADDLGMVPIVGYFYFGQDERLADEQAVIAAAENATDWLLATGHRNVLVEIGNEADHPGYGHGLIRADRGDELIGLVQRRSEGRLDTPAGRLLVSTSLCGGRIPPTCVAASADFLLLHGNGVEQPARIREMVSQCRGLAGFHGQPILFNEDDHFAFDAGENNMRAAVAAGAGWGFFDWRMEGEGFDAGYQSVPVNWAVSSPRKRGFFDLLAELTGGGR